MANTYAQLYVHITFSVQGRQRLLRPDLREEVFKYMAGIIKNKKHRVLAVNGVEDHVHILLSLRPNTALSDLVRDIKNNTSAFINERCWTQGVFRWQEGYGAFSCSPAHARNAQRYIQLQVEHHRRRSFQDEYLRFLREFDVQYDTRYVIDPKSE